MKVERIQKLRTFDHYIGIFNKTEYELFHYITNNYDEDTKNEEFRLYERETTNEVTDEKLINKAIEILKGHIIKEAEILRED